MSALSSPSDQYRSQVAELTADQREVLARESQEAAFGFKTLADFAAAGRPVPKDLAFNILYLAEARVAQLCKLVGVELDSAKDRESRYAALREANRKIAHLERQLGQGVNPQTLLPAVKTLCDKVRAWWSTEGFGHVSEASVGPYGMSVKLSCFLMNPPRYSADAPATGRKSKEAWLKSLEERGFQLVYPRGDDPAVAATTENQALLEQLIRHSFPSARMGGFSGYLRSEAEPLGSLREVEMFLPNLEEVAALPDNPVGAPA